MRRANRGLVSLPFVVAFAVCGLMSGCTAAPPGETVVVDKEHNDSHKWDDHENQTWHRYLNENHRDTHEYTKADPKEQSDYWNWRHSHPD